ncbi:transmembrane protein 19 [Lepeophtheirus salmonis]|uniref:transmembrane protein 19 n=1 Tax=Lepeophtheirus salmonis TaxID=72036 RepID=UPI001AEA8F08|nr:transmembrane protein 19-like [Lepeophtheirus salmonis]
MSGAPNDNGQLILIVVYLLFRNYEEYSFLILITSRSVKSNFVTNSRVTTKLQVTLTSMETLHPVLKISSLLYLLVCMISLIAVGKDIKNGSLSKEPHRLILAISISLLIIIRSLRKANISKSGAFASFFVGFVHIYSNPPFTGALLSFFFSSSTATRYKEATKKKISGEDFKTGGQRNWVQVISNGLVSSFAACLYLLSFPNKEAPLSIYGVAVLVANASCNGDTWASELGTVLSRSDPFNIVTLKTVPKGTNGGISPVGLLVSFLGGAFVGFNYVWPLIVFYSLPLSLYRCCYIILIGGLGGFLGSLVDSVLGALFQYSGKDSSGAVYNYPSSGVKHICGIGILDNNSVNILACLISTLIISFTVQNL